MHTHGELKAYLLGIFVASAAFSLTYYATSIILERSSEPVPGKNQPSRRHLGRTAILGQDTFSRNGRTPKDRLLAATAHACLQSRPGDEVSTDLDCKKRLPQAIGIGVEKCGTSALSFFLNSHPNLIHSVPQEIYYWNKHQNESLDWYRDQMPVSSKHEVTMEKTPSYIFDVSAPTRIKAVMPDTKFIVIIRDPVVRAVSDYLHLLTIAWPEFFIPRVAPPGQEALCYLNTTFEGSVIRPNGEVNSDNAILVHGAYVIYFREWLKVFPRKQFLVIDGDAFIKNPLPALQQMEEFLGLPKFFNGRSIYFDERKGFYCKSLPFKQCAGESKGRRHPVIDDDVIRKLKAYYRPYDDQLEKLLGQTFSWSDHTLE
ncbi:heparan sulfate glucosamine 3-O-sulfotransferase 1-like [Diadema setosum]|uniref:heparan sulfate glucosamine 3-O-sulfotransferase 1-like n=1 Tax=Diadema setosum TaxID=31175 RepID=UPI003B3A7EA4